jgi:hypothetical protein
LAFGNVDMPDLERGNRAIAWPDRIVNAISARSRRSMSVVAGML